VADWLALVDARTVSLMCLLTDPSVAVSLDMHVCVCVCGQGTALSECVVSSASLPF